MVTDCGIGVQATGVGGVGVTRENLRAVAVRIGGVRVTWVRWVLFKVSRPTRVRPIRVRREGFVDSTFVGVRDGLAIFKHPIHRLCR